MLKKTLMKAAPFAVVVTAALVLGNAVQAQSAGPGTTAAGVTGASPAASAPPAPGMAGSRKPDSDKSKDSKTTSPADAVKETDKTMPLSTPEQTNLNRSSGEGNVTGPSPVTGTESGTGKPVSPGTPGSKAN